MIKKRCFGNESQSELAHYHDNEWGIPVYEDTKHFELLLLETAQAGLSWEIILKKREGYRRAFHDFNPYAIASMTDKELLELKHTPNIIRNKQKIFSARTNARSFITIQTMFGSFNSYVWSFVNHSPIIGHWKTIHDIPVTTKESDELSLDLKERGMTFLGSVTVYAYMQASGLVNDHYDDCFCKKKVT